MNDLRELHSELYKLNKLYLEFGTEKAAIEKLQYEESAIEVRLIIFKKQKSRNKKKRRNNEFRKYHKKVWEITNTQDLQSLEHYDKRAFKGYHLDHKISIFYGFKNKINPYMIGNIKNLRMIPYKDNMNKGIQCLWD